MYELKKQTGKVLTSKSVGTGLSSYEKRIYRAAVSQMLRNTGLNFSAGTVKFTLEQATKAQRGSRGIALFFL